MLKIEGKTFMNIQEAVQWLLDNNALPFQCSANYIANTEIGMGTIVNPSPAKVRIGSLIFFADSKVSTVTGLTENGFIVSDQYNDLVDDVVYVSNVALNASGHLIVTLSNGDTIDAGLIKQVNNFSIDGSQHLIATYNDGTSTDLGAIFSGNITIGGNLTVTGLCKPNTFEQATANWSSIPYISDSVAIYNRFEVIGNILYIVINLKIVNNTGSTHTYYGLGGNISIPNEYGTKIIDFEGDSVASAKAQKTMICGAKAYGFKNLTTQQFDHDINIAIRNHTDAGYVDIGVYNGDGITLNDGETYYITGRLFLTLI